MNEREAAGVLARLDEALHEWWDDDHGSGASHACRPVPSEDEFVAALARHGLVLRAAAQADTAPGGGRESAIEALGRAIDWIKPEPGMDGPHGGYIGGVTRQRAVTAIEQGIAALAEPSRDAGLDVRRVKQAVTNIAVRHGVVKDQPPLNWTLMSMYGYSATIADMDAEIAAEYDRLAPAPAPPAADLARWLQDTFESQPAITIRQGVEPQVAWRALADELLRRWGR